MKSTLRNIIVTVLGLVIGGAVNMGLIMISSHVIPPPPGSDLTSEEGLKASMHLMEPKHFMFPFLAHAVGTLLASMISAGLGASHKARLAYICGVLFLLGGIMEVYNLPSPIWFSILDLGFAYIPMSWIAIQLVTKRQAN